MQLKTPLFILLILFSCQLATAQNGQTIRGLVIDQQSEMPLIGATVELISVEPTKGTTTDIDGEFVLENAPVGRQALRFSYLGYGTVTLPNVMVTAGKEVQLEVTLEESIENLDAVVVTAEVEKDKANNELATVSARNFSLEEVTRYSGGRNDVSRLAASFAGVNIANDSRNDIVIRGNSPTGVLWRLEGIPIPNPNHFSTLGTTGGPVSAVNTNLLKNSDFMTSAFPSEYGNALAGVFDLGFRNGNKDRYEFTAQLAAFSGLEFMAEGPLTKEKNSSFLVSYRHSFVELASFAGINFGTSALPRYKDLTFKVDLAQGKFGKLSFFGLGGTSNIDFLADETEEGDFFVQGGNNSYVTSRLGIIGLNHRYLVDNQTYIRMTLAASTSQNSFNNDFIIDTIGTAFRDIELDDRNSRFSLSSYINRKHNARLTSRIGFLLEQYQLNLFTQTRSLNDEEWQIRRDFEQGVFFGQAYAQTQYKINSRLTLNAGLRGQYFALNDSWSIEPRAAINFHATPKSTLSLGYGWHEQMQPLPLYFVETYVLDGTLTRTNENLDFTNSQHFVLAYDWKPVRDWRVKSEAYYQAISDVPVQGGRAHPFSALNIGDDFGFPNRDSLLNEGTGKNYGVELTIEKFFSKNYYVLMTGSLFDSKYTGSDGIERNTSFNNRYTFNILAGKEIPFGKSKENTLTFDTKFTMAGGRFYTPFDEEASRFAGTGIRDDQRINAEQYAPYIRWDVKIGYRLNSTKRKFSQTFFLDFQNVTNHRNIFSQRWNAERGEPYYVYQIGFFPDVLWRVEF